MQQLILVRHGETIWNHAGRLQGATNVPLSDAGYVQAAQVAQRLAAEPLDAIYSSDLLRAMLTAQVIAEGRGVAVTEEPRLRQSSRGHWEGLAWAEIAALFPADYAAFQNDPHHTPPGGEPFDQTVARITALLADLARDHPGDATVLLVSHGQILRLLLCIALDIAPERAEMFTFDNAALAELRFTPGGAVIAYLNDTHHLHPAPTRE